MIEKARRNVLRAVQGCLLVALVGALLALLAPVPTDQRVLYLAGSLAITVLAVLGLVQLVRTPEEESP